jgi:hypothetical protein
MTTTKTSAKQQAQAILDMAKKLGFNVHVRGTIMTVSKRIIPGDLQSFAEADMTVYSVLELLPRTSAGSDWGTDGGSVGGMSAVNTGNFLMNRSGGSKSVLKALTTR